MLKHPDNIPGHTLPGLAENVGDLRYDALAKFLRSLAEKLEKDSAADAKRGRPKLANALLDGSAGVILAAEAVERAWKICEPSNET